MQNSNLNDVNNGILNDENIRRLILDGITDEEGPGQRHLIKDVKRLSETEQKDLLSRVGPCSLDVRLGSSIYVERNPEELRAKLDFIVNEQNRNIVWGNKEASYAWREYAARTDFKDVFCEIDISNTTPENPYLLKPKSFILGSTKHVFMFPDNIVGSIVLRSTWGRRGLNHAFCGLCDPGVGNHPSPQKTGLAPTLELINELNHHPLPIYAGAKIAQIIFTKMDLPSEPYWVNGHYGESEIKPILSREYESFGEF